jgi:nucleobase:cation symporter-1, NCS1 family
MVRLRIETRCIDFVPEAERYGSAKRLFTIWFSANMQVTALVVGTLGISRGLDFLSTAVAILIGNAVGGIFMAAHSAQGPHLGVPQMIQSRAQFGVFGAALPLVVVVLTYVLFSAANGVMMRESVKALAPVSDTPAIVLFGMVTLVVSAIGYELIHKIGAALSVVSLVTCGIATAVVLAAYGLPMLPPGGAIAFRTPAFWLVLAQAASWTLGFCTFVADYSRYLPNTVPTRSTFWYTYGGCTLGASLIMIFGALLASTVGATSSDPATPIVKLFPHYQTPVRALLLLGVIQINALNFYSAYMGMVTIFSGFRGMPVVRPSMKYALVVLVFLMATGIAIATQYKFDDYFSDILNAQIYVLLPWSSINLVDYYLIRDGRYCVPAFYDPRGEYGKLNRAAFVAFFLALLAEVPFISLSFFQGPIALKLGVDVTFIPALILPGAFYFYLMRSRRAGVDLARARGLSCNLH